MRKTIAGNIAKYRKQLGMTQIDLSEKINYSDKSISKWERGDGIPDFVWGLPLVQHFRKNNRKSEHRTKLLNLLCAVLFYLVR